MLCGRWKRRWKCGDGQYESLPPKWRQNYKLLLHCGNIGGQRRLHDGQEPMKWSIAGTGFAALCMKGFGEAHTQGTDGCVSWEPRYAWGRKM